MATISKRGDFQWRVQIRRKGYPATYKTFDTKADAQKWARQVENEMDRGIFVSRTEAENTSLKEAIERFKNEYIPRLSHAKREEARATLIQNRPFACKTLAAIRTKDIADFIKERESEGVGGKTIRLDLNIISRIFEVAHTDWGMESLTNPVKRVHKPKTTGGRTRRLEKNEEKKLLRHANDKLRPVIIFALATAMRRAEIASLTWNNVDLKRRTAFLPKTKNGEARTVPLSPLALNLLEELKKHKADNQSVFNISAASITYAMQTAIKNAKLTDFRFHDLRHEAISRLFEETDLDIMEIRVISGHKTLQMLARYTHLRTARLADRLAGMGRTGQRLKLVKTA